MAGEPAFADPCRGGQKKEVAFFTGNPDFFSKPRKQNIRLLLRGFQKILLPHATYQSLLVIPRPARIIEI